MKFMAESTNTRDVTDLLPAELERITELTDAGTITQLWLKGDSSGAFLLLETTDEAEARSTLAAMPVAAAGATDVVVTPLVDLDAGAQG